jgi:nucleotide-binding universal stress UspA family protein
VKTLQEGAFMANVFLVAIDGSEHAMRALDVAVTLANPMHGELVLCYVIDSARAARLSFGEPALLDGSYDALRSDGEYYLDQAMQRASLAQAKATTVLAYGDPAEEIRRVASQKHATMIVMGTHGRTGLAHIVMGSVAEGVMRRASVPVVVVPPLRSATESSAVA